MDTTYFLTLFTVLFQLILTVHGQTCPDGFPAVFKCTASKKHNGGYYCKDDEKLGCEIINGISYCCDKEKDSEPGEAVTKKSAVEQASNETGVTKKTRKVLTTTLSSRKSKSDKTERKSEEEEEEPKKKVKPRTRKPLESSSSCLDRGNDCRFRTQLCTNPLYSQIMHDQCPRTCHFCDPNEDGSVEAKNKIEGGDDNEEKETKEKKSQGDCEDQGPDCSRLPDLCNNPYYTDFMQKECPQTCGAC